MAMVAYRLYARARGLNDLSRGTASQISPKSTTHKIQQMFEDDAMGVKQITKWFNRLKSHLTLVESDQSSARPRTSRNAIVVKKEENLMMKDC
ncbi:hypothetical protein TNCV_2932801 [Trichonephila clavipes]|nr:hypothetical protein TNCV_2932801 [Trichonephila clavipes]